MEQAWEYVKIALKNLMGNKGRSLLTMLGIIIGISSVIMIISIGNGVKGGINSELNSLGGGILFIYSSGDNPDGVQVYFTEEDFAAVESRVESVKSTTPYLQYSGTALGSKGQVKAILNAGTVGLEYFTKDPIIKGRFFSEREYFSGRRVAVVTESGAKKLFGHTNIVGMTVNFDVMGQSGEFTIVGVRKDNASKIFSAFVNTEEIQVEVPLTAVTASFGVEPVFYNMIVVTDGGDSTQVAKDTINYLEARHNVRGKNALALQNFDDQTAQINQILNYITIFVVLVAAVSLLVGGIGVMNIMLVSVTERTREIGIRKALGARTGSILIQFLSESAIITLLGGVIGIVFGLAVAVLVCNLIGFQASISPAVVLGSTLFSSAVGLFFGIYPAKKAAKLSPIEALRHE